MSENYDKYETIEDKNQETEEVGVIDEEALRFVFDFIKRNNFKAVIDEIVENYKKNSQLSISKDECKNIIATAGGQLVISGVIKNSTVKKDIKCWSISKSYRESSFENILDDVDAVLVMTVNPGFAGQKLIPSTLGKISALRKYLDENGYENIEIEVDGNVSFENARLMSDAGANIFVAGTSSIFKAGQSMAENTAKLRESVE